MNNVEFSNKLTQIFSLSSFIFLLFLNLSTLFINSIKKANISKLCNDFINPETFLYSVDLFRNKLSLVSISVFPEIFSGFKALGARCFGLFITNEKSAEISFITNNLIFYFFVFLIMFAVAIFVLTNNKNIIINYFKYIFIFFTLFNLINFQSNQLSFIFNSLIGISSFCMIFKATILNNSISKDNFHIELKIFLISWILLGVNEMKKLMFEDADYYHFSLWLTNYSQGYNRRGFIGTLLTFLGDYLDPRILLIATFSLLAIFISFFLYKLFTLKEQNLISLIIFLSPAFISFYSFDIKGSFRKELIGIFAFIYLVFNLLKKKDIYIPLTVYYFAVLSHPANIFLFPAIGIILQKNGFKYRKIFLFSLPLILYVGGEFVFSNNIDFSKNYFCNEMNMKPNINIDCNSLDPQFAAAVYSSSSNYLEITQSLVSLKSLTYYITSAIFGFAPFLFDKKFLKSNKLLFLYFISYLPLLALGYDWGRWIVLFLITISIFYFVEETKSKIDFNKVVIFCVFIFYIYFWKLAHCCNTELFPFSTNLSLFESSNFSKSI